MWAEDVPDEDLTSHTFDGSDEANDTLIETNFAAGKEAKNVIHNSIYFGKHVTYMNYPPTLSMTTDHL